ALLRVFQLLDDEDSRSLARDETVAILVERPRRPGGIVVALAERAGGGEPGDAEEGDGRLGAAADDDVRVAVLDMAHRFADGMVPRRAGGDGRVIHAGGAIPDGDLPAHQVHDDGGN